MTPPTQKGNHEMNDTIGRRAWRTARHAARRVRDIHREQVYMWECWWRIGRTAPPEATGQLRWVPSLEGHQLAGSYLPGPDQPASASGSAP